MRFDSHCSGWDSTYQKLWQTTNTKIMIIKIESWGRRILSPKGAILGPWENISSIPPFKNGPPPLFFCHSFLFFFSFFLSYQRNKRGRRPLSVCFFLRTLSSLHMALKASNFYFLFLFCLYENSSKKVKKNKIPRDNLVAAWEIFNSMNFNKIIIPWAYSFGRFFEFFMH